MGEDQKMILPPGFEFDPTDEELIVSFLNRRAANLQCYPNIIPDLDIFAAHPWGLHEKAFWSKKEWYFFSGLKGNRSTEKGFWKEVGLSERIFRSINGEEVGTKNYLVFCCDNGVQTNWIMEEFRLTNYASQLGQNQLQDVEWVVCRVREGKVYDYEDKSSSSNGDGDGDGDGDEGVELSYLDEVFFSMDNDDDEDQDEITFPT